MRIKKPKFQIFWRKNHSWFWIPRITKSKLMWKDKWSTPRCEREPHFYFEWMWFIVYGVWGCDRYWEQRIWIKVYNEGDYEKAKSTWPWSTGKNNESTWRDELTNPKSKQK
jgi:hypothetical protein